VYGGKSESAFRFLPASGLSADMPGRLDGWRTRRREWAIGGETEAADDDALFLGAYRGTSVPWYQRRQIDLPLLEGGSSD
jgi:hypothetical protein